MKNLLLLLLTVSSCMHLPCSADEEKGTHKASKNVVKKAGSTEESKKVIEKTGSTEESKKVIKKAGSTEESKKVIEKAGSQAWIIKVAIAAVVILGGFYVASQHSEQSNREAAAVLAKKKKEKEIQKKRITQQTEQAPLEKPKKKEEKESIAHNNKPEKEEEGLEKQKKEQKHLAVGRKRKEEEEQEKRTVMGIDPAIFLKYIRDSAKNLGKLNSENPVLFFGNTGAGKSTIIRLLLLGKLFKQKYRVRYNSQWVYKSKIEVTGSNGEQNRANVTKYPEVGHGFSSCTDLPESYPLLGHHLDLCDFAGFNDTRGESVRAGIAVAAKKFLSQTEQVKAIVFVISERDFLAGRGDSVIEVLMGITEMFEKPIDHADSIFFALTFSERTSKEFMGEIWILNDTMKKRGDQAKTYKPLCDLLDKMLDKKYQGNFFVVDPFSEASSNLIIESLKKSSGIPQKAIKFIGDADIHRKTYKFFNVCAKEGNAMLDVYDTYPKKIKDQAKRIEEQDVKMSELSQSIAEAKKILTDEQSTLEDINESQNTAEKDEMVQVEKKRIDIASGTVEKLQSQRDECSEKKKTMEADLAKLTRELQNNKNALNRSGELFETIMNTHGSLGFSDKNITGFARRYTEHIASKKEMLLKNDTQ